MASNVKKQTSFAFEDGQLGEQGLDGRSNESPALRPNGNGTSVIYNLTHLSVKRVNEIFDNTDLLLGLCRLASRLHYELMLFPVDVVVHRMKSQVVKEFVARRNNGCWQRTRRRVFFWGWSLVVAMFPLFALVNVYGHGNIAKCDPMPEDQDLKTLGTLLGLWLASPPASRAGAGTDASNWTSVSRVRGHGPCRVFAFLSAHRTAVVLVSLAAPIVLTFFWGMLAKCCIRLHNCVHGEDSLEDSCFLQVKRVAFFPLLYFWHKFMDSHVPRVKYANDPVEDGLFLCFYSPPSLYVCFVYLTFWADMLFLGYLSGRFMVLLVAAWPSSQVLCWMTNRVLSGDPATMLEVEFQLRSWTPKDSSGNLVRAGRDSVLDKIRFASKLGGRHLNLTENDLFEVDQLTEHTNQHAGLPSLEPAQNNSRELHFDGFFDEHRYEPIPSAAEPARKTLSRQRRQALSSRGCSDFHPDSVAFITTISFTDRRLTVDLLTGDIDRHTE